MTVLERINCLRGKMISEGIDWYLMTSDDFHSSEYVSDFFKVREYYTGFTGDNAYLILNKEKAYMWTDGRFFIQAEIELAGSTIELMRMGEEGVPTLSEFIKDNVVNGQTLYFDGRTVDSGLGEKISGILEKTGANLKYEGDLAGELWTNRPGLPVEPIWILSDEMSGENIISKINRVREAMAKEDADSFLLAKLDDIAWLTNMRGNDIECNPVFLSYLFLTQKECFLFLRDEVVTDEIKNYLEKSNVILKRYDEFFEFIEAYKAGKAVMLDKSGVSFRALKLAAGNNEIKNVPNPTTLMKAVKNVVELERLKEATIMDSVAVTKFMYWLKNEADLSNTSELDCAAKIDGLRKELPGYIELSFPTIAGYGANAAMMHYEAKEGNYAYLKPEGMLLVDSGGQYEKGTTDVTRTFVLGPVSEEIKLHFSRVAAGMLAVADTKFLYGCTGRNLDIMAREPLWEIGIDYKCGTGHGVGYILNVHEGPHSLRWKYVKGAEEAVFEEGMIVSDEPGVYIEGSHGIRTENVILCTKREKNGDGQFMGFEHLTFVPIDLDGINPEYLEPKDIKRLNKYHADVYEKISPYLDAKEAEWLKEATRAI
ncbi:MAG: aminopeptidase P family protein [Lachnospiraceae bacterium]|nr:aminopeptidase P family protein [Lachnospiraceae bacterium]